MCLVIKEFNHLVVLGELSSSISYIQSLVGDFNDRVRDYFACEILQSESEAGIRQSTNLIRVN